MFTVCPKCALTLVVTAADLRVAQGYVRCGRCSNVFNALGALSDERQPAEARPAGEPEPPAASLEFNPTATNVSDVFVEPQPGDDDATGTFESIVLESPDTDDEADFEPGETTDHHPDDVVAVEAQPAEDPDAVLRQELQSLAERIEAEQRQPLPAPELPAGLDTDESAAPAAWHGQAWLWRTGVITLALALVLQATHHYRNTLAAVPQLHGPLTSIYAALDVSLAPRWDVAAYQVRQLGAATNPDDATQLIVRASIKNTAQRAQPLPLLRVVVQDRFGNRIATRDVAPASYVPPAISPRAPLAAGGRVDAEIRFVDPGDDAVGFEIDACLAAEGGGVNCANRQQ